MIEGIRISPMKIVYVLIIIVLALVFMSLAGQYFKDLFPDSDFTQKVIAKLNLDEEKNSLPTWFQSSSLLLSSLLLFVIGLVRREKKDRDNRYWWLLSFIFLFLSLDESVSIHEQMTIPLRTAFNLEGFLFLSWVIPALLAMAVLGGVFAKFLLRLPSRTRNLMIASGVVFLAGAIGLEMVGANYMFMMGNPPDIGNDFGYALITTVEELFEMAGITMFIYCLLSYLSGDMLEADRVPQRKPSEGDSVGALICGVS